MPDEATPEPIPTQNNTGPLLVVDAARDRFTTLFRIVVALTLGGLLVGDIAIYSLYQAMRSQVEAHEHRIERLDKMVADMLTTNDNATKIESINTKVDSIDVQVQELTTTLKEDAAKVQDTPPEPANGTKPKK
jgi:hypothetical protein